MIRILSLGAGVQSTAMALMAARGELQPMPDCAIFADVGEESVHTYMHLAWIMGRRSTSKHTDADLPFPVHVVSAWNGYGKPSIRGPLGNEILAATRGDGKAGSHSRPPFFVGNDDGRSRGTKPQG